ncbi:hypothetical protein J7E79_02645 [Bacillus sp. ISL-40]|uniref:hypothetical protein n=1 Tax=unclassified Bacillus (in: firmicutes) TaxID=185979 RepID=UPI001BE68AF1|nr:MULTISPECIES: hypothetical protein [unclassified Bacillus (in: firmicutes)]MBT2696334.1 hypothetical protein [Bacillus sp. ISL-40]MBT2743183.1 hypothetical protein [Bacillus sp. ISL-77]
MVNRENVVLLSNLTGSGSANRPNPSTNRNVETNTDERVSRMNENEQVTQRDLNHLEEKTNLKLENLKTEIKGEITNLNTSIDGKFNTLEQKMERMFLQQKIDISTERKENIKWIVGTGLAIVGTIAAILALFPSFR